VSTPLDFLLATRLQNAAKDETTLKIVAVFRRGYTINQFEDLREGNISTPVD